MNCVEDDGWQSSVNTWDAVDFYDKFYELQNKKQHDKFFRNLLK